jgi:hypothetical protein
MLFLFALIWGVSFYFIRAKEFASPGPSGVAGIAASGPLGGVLRRSCSTTS